MSAKLIINPERWIGTSRDKKPTGVPIGSEFYEDDTRKTFRTHDGNNWGIPKPVALYDKVFAFTIKTTAPNETFTFPFEATGTYSFTVNWGDGSNSGITIWNQAETTHTYTNPGTYQINIRGTITEWRFNNGGDRTLIYDILQWGPLNLGNNNGYFYGCTNLTVSATDILDLINTTTFQNFFRECSSLTTVQSIDSWNISNVINMRSVFRAAGIFNQDLSSWDTSSVTDTRSMFLSSSTFDQDIGVWDITSLAQADSMFLNVTLSTANYSALLVGWEAQDPLNNVVFHGGNSTYTGAAAIAARAHLVLAVGGGGHGWTITDGGAV